LKNLSRFFKIFKIFAKKRKNRAKYNEIVLIFNSTPSHFLINHQKIGSTKKVPKFKKISEQ